MPSEQATRPRVTGLTRQPVPWEEILAQEATGELLAALIAKEELRYLLALARTRAPRITSARTEATNRMVKDATRIAFGFRNLENQRRKVRLHCKRTTISQPVRG